LHSDIIPLQKIYWITGGKFPDQSHLFLYPVVIFTLRINIRIVIKNCDPEIPGQVFQYITAARGAAAMEQQCRRGFFFICTELIKHLIQLLLVITFIHKIVIPLRYSFHDS